MSAELGPDFLRKLTQSATPGQTDFSNSGRETQLRFKMLAK